MSVATLLTPQSSPLAKYKNAAEWFDALGNIPPERILMNPWPGTATEGDLLRFVERDKRLVELIDGTLVEKPMGWFESLIAARLIIAIGTFVEARGLGFVTGEAGMIRMLFGRVRLPDVAFVSINDLPGGQFPTEPIPTLPPTLAVEVLSPSNTKQEIHQKLKEYFESGTRLAWVIDPETQTIAIYDSFSDEPSRILKENEKLDGGTVLPGFTMSIALLFVKLPPKTA